MGLECMAYSLRYGEVVNREYLGIRGRFCVTFLDKRIFENAFRHEEELL